MFRKLFKSIFTYKDDYSKYWEDSRLEDHRSRIEKNRRMEAKNQYALWSSGITPYHPNCTHQNVEFFK